MSRLSAFWTGAVAYVSLLTGAGLSIAGNIADTYRQRGDATDVLDVILAAAAPALVLLTIEMFVSPRWSKEIGFQLLRWFGCATIGVLAMYVSWVHLHELLISRGQQEMVSAFWPFAIDGMAIMSTGLILSTRMKRVVSALLYQYARPIGPMPLTLIERAVSVSAHAQEEEALTIAELFSPTLPEAPVSAPPVSVRTERSLSDAQQEALTMLRDGEVPKVISERTGVSASTVRKMRQALTSITHDRRADVSALKLRPALVALMREEAAR